MHKTNRVYDEDKQQSLGRRRRLILNNDGGDATRADGTETERPRAFLDVRTTPLLGTHVDTICYSTHGGFGMCYHHSKVGQVADNARLAALIAEGTDPMKVMTGYGHKHGIEVFWSMRMNDTHDGSRPDRFAANRFKNENTDCLLGAPGARPKHGEWSAVDYACEKVRALALALVEEICRDYDVDGIELDFFRHPVFFRTTAQGVPVTDLQREQMTDLVRQMAEVAAREGKKRGRPLLIAARVPDDPDYAATIGIDIERWMREGLIDLYIPSAYFRLRSWRDNVELGHRHGVKVYPGLSESRVGGGHHKDTRRSSDECYRARAANAWQAGADGIYLFNLFDPHRRIWGEIGDPETLKSLDKLYFSSVRGVGSVAGGAYPHAPFIGIPTLNPGAPLPLEPGGRRVVRIEVAEDLLALPAANKPAVTLTLRCAAGNSAEGEAWPAGLESDLTVAFNGRALQAGKRSGEGLSFAVSPDDLRTGWNTVEVCFRGTGHDVRLLDIMLGADYSGALLSDTAYLDRTRKNM